VIGWGLGGWFWKWYGFVAKHGGGSQTDCHLQLLGSNTGQEMPWNIM
jgi:hypothetical protein